MPPVTELAIIPLQDGITGEDASLLAALKTARAVQEAGSGFPAFYLMQVEDPTILYILGTWSSAAEHFSFLPGAENQRMLKALAPLIKMDEITLFHLSHPSIASSATSPPPAQLLNDLVSSMGAKGEKGVVSLNRHFIKDGQKEGFEGKFGAVGGLLGEYALPRVLLGGWRVEKDVVDGEEGKEKEEFVLLSGFDSVDHHLGFAKTAEFETYKGITEFVDGFELKHLRRLEI